jgi:anti-sigma regulatory factor (Ser/Thr protein kinase)
MPEQAALIRCRIADPALLTHWLALGRLTLPGEPQHVRSARTFVEQTIGAHHPRADEALLLTSELVTNAVTHSRSGLPGGTIDVVVAAKVAGLLICVTDDGSDSTLPAISTASGGEHGNGLLLTDSIADGWGCLRCSHRVMVWFKLRTKCCTSANAGQS